MRLIEGENGFNVNLSPVRQEQQLVDGFAGREKKCPVVEVDLDLEFRLEVRDQPRGGSDRHDLDGRACGFDWIKSVGISHARRKLRTSAKPGDSINKRHCARALPKPLRCAEGINCDHLPPIYLVADAVQLTLFLTASG